MSLETDTTPPPADIAETTLATAETVRLTSIEHPGQPTLKGAALIADYVKRLPDTPGVYRMLGEADEVLYVGKARSLKKRVVQYAQGRAHSQRLQHMVALTRAMEFVTTRTEADALLLESNLIKRLKPRFNITLRDDKSFAEILLRRDHPTPQIRKHRGGHATPGDYFGPFASTWAVNRTLNTLQKAFLLRSCSDSVFDTRTRPCMLHQIKRCSAPCTGLIDKAGYDELVGEAHDFLRGKSRAVTARLAKEMTEAAEAMDYERAARIRDRIRGLAGVSVEQGINPEGVDEADVIAVHEQGGQACVQVFFFRAGQNWGNRAYFPKVPASGEQDQSDILDAFMGQFYDDRHPPKLILLSHAAPNAEVLAEALAIKAGRKVEIAVPVKGEKKRLVEHAHTNAREALGRRMAETGAQGRLLAGVCEAFKLEGPPERIEVYDNSHIQGTNAVGGMIVAGPEGFMKSQYRKFNIKSTEITPRRRLRDDERGAHPPLRPPAEGGGGGGRVEPPRPDPGGWRPGPARRRAGRDGRPGRRRHRRGGRRQGPGSRRGAGAVLHARPHPLHARTEGSGALLPSAPARRGPPLRHRRPSHPQEDRPHQEPVGRDRRRWAGKEARPPARFRLGAGRQPGERGRPDEGGGRQPRPGRAHLQLLPQGGVMGAPADDVIGLYGRHAAAWLAARGGARLVEKGWLDRFVALLPPGACVLDLGCGTGDPMARYLVSRGVSVTGVDGAPEMVALFRAALPDQDAVVADMRALRLGRRFDGILAWDSLFHLPAADQRTLFQRLRDHARPGAPLLFNTGSEQGESIGAFEGEPLHHASLDLADYRNLLREAGFQIVAHAFSDADCGGRTVWLARRTPATGRS